MAVRAHYFKENTREKWFLIYAVKNCMLAVFAFLWTFVTLGWKWPAAGLVWLVSVPFFAFGAYIAYTSSGSSFTLHTLARNAKRMNISTLPSSNLRMKTLDVQRDIPSIVVISGPDGAQLRTRDPRYQTNTSTLKPQKTATKSNITDMSNYQQKSVRKSLTPPKAVTRSNPSISTTPKQALQPPASFYANLPREMNSDSATELEAGMSASGMTPQMNGIHKT
jgi:hypothetical protein